MWRLEAQDQRVGREGLLPGLSLAGKRHLLPVSSCGLSSVRVCVLINSSFKDTNHMGLGSIPGTSFSCNHPYKESPNTFNSPEVLGVRMSMSVWGM